MFWIVLLRVFEVLCVVFAGLGVIAIIKKPGSAYASCPEEKNHM